jgi:hypothetical protein
VSSFGRYLSQTAHDHGALSGSRGGFRDHGQKPGLLARKLATIISAPWP